MPFNKMMQQKYLFNSFFIFNNFVSVASIMKVNTNNNYLSAVKIKSGLSFFLGQGFLS